jgi:chaperonin GroEL
MKQVLLSETKEKIKKGVDILANAVKITLGGKGKNVIINNGFELPKIINDGVTIAKEVEVEDDVENTGATLAKQAAEKTNDEAGDGTTTTIVLLQEFLNEMMKVKTTDFRGFREEVKKVVDEVIKYIDENKRDLKEGDIYRIAKNSSLDEDIAKTVEEVMEKIGKDGVVTIEDGQKAGITSEVVQGIKIDDGYISPYMITDQETMRAEIKDAPILLTKKSITSVSDILPVLEALQSQSINQLILMVEDITDEVIAPLVVNKMKGVFSTVVVKTRNMEDIATVTGAEIITTEGGQQFTAEALGWADKVEVGKYHTIVSGGREEKEVVDEKIEELKKVRENAEDGDDKIKASQRIARLQNGVSVIKIAGENDIQTKEKKLKLEDALNAVKSAMEDGIIEGGGMALLRASEMIVPNEPSSEIVDEAIKLVYKVIRKPFEQILINADEDFEEVITDWDGKGGYNVVTRNWENFYKSGIIDPAKVVKRALINAVSMGTSIMTAEASVIIKKEGTKNNEN